MMEDSVRDDWTGVGIIVEELMRKNIDWFRTTIPENINNYLEHRGLDADDVISISVEGGFFYVFYKIFEAEENDNNKKD